MQGLDIPQPLDDLVAASDQETATATFVRAVSTLLADNGTPFFPGYTDHGTKHVERVLAAEVRLIPKSAWEKGLLRPRDGIVLVCATLLHDLAMHIRSSGFVELVSDGSRFTARPWFSQDQPQRPPDLAWSDLWAAFQREARHFGTSQIEILFGPSNAGLPAVAHETELRPENWTESDHLLIGEFLRRHHARLAHEIAHCGFPGMPTEDFPALSELVPELSDPIGVVARSHNEPLRAMVGYLEYLNPGSMRPAGSLLLYHMGLLRVADYFQIDADRAPPLLLTMKAPVSPLSIEEWNKHGAISSIAWEHRDPAAIDITVSPRHGLRTHLALSSMLEEMQLELDTTTAVLSEIYTAPDLLDLRLTRHRIHTNLDEPSLHELLPYLPRPASLRSDPDLFRLVIRALYGNQPSVGGRELIQNAVDAVRARRMIERQRGRKIPREDLRIIDAEILVTLEDLGGDRFVLRVADRGVGMSPDLIIDYFLQAGASFAPRPPETEEVPQPEIALKAGRFGIGAFAAFLLGPEIEVISRHIDADKGVSFRARIDEDLVELDWTDAPIGTEVSIPFDGSSLPGPRWAPDDRGTARELLEAIASFYRLADPSIKFEYREGDLVSEVNSLADVPLPDGEQLPEQWRNVECDGVDAVLWRMSLSDKNWEVSRSPEVVHNGILIRNLSSTRRDENAYQWSDQDLADRLLRPDLAVFDSRHRLGITLDRYALIDSKLPFEHELLEGIGADLVARALSVGVGLHPLQVPHANSVIQANTGWIPALGPLLRRYIDDFIVVLWRLKNPGERSRGESTAIREFLNPETPTSWASLRYRTQVTIGESEHEAVAVAAAAWARRHGAREVATISSSLVRPRRRNRDRLQFNEQRAPKGRVTTRGRFTDRSVEQDFRHTAEQLLESGNSFVGLSAFDGFSESWSAALQTFAEPWIDSIGGFLPRPRPEREEKADEALAKRPTLGDAYDSWRQFASREGLARWPQA